MEKDKYIPRIVDYIIKNSIKEFVEKEIIVEDIKNENFEISTKSDQNKI